MAPGVPLDESRRSHWRGCIHLLIKADGRYILFDAEIPTSDGADILLKGLDDVMNGSKLQLIMLTHGHPDHCGALAALVKAFPGAQVVFHEEEAPYLLGRAQHVDGLAACILRCIPLVQAWLHNRDLGRVTALLALMQGKVL